MSEVEEKWISPVTNAAFMDEMPSEFDMFWNGSIKFEEMSEEAQKMVESRLNAIKATRRLGEDRE